VTWGSECAGAELAPRPGAETQDGVGSGMLSAENDEPTAERMSVLYAAAGIDQADTLPWNVYPWYVNRASTAAGRDRVGRRGESDTPHAPG
jgi:hypothetical protein